MSFNRPNLHYEVRYKSANEDAYPSIIDLIKDFNSRRQARLIREGNGTIQSGKVTLIQVISLVLSAVLCILHVGPYVILSLHD